MTRVVHFPDVPPQWVFHRDLLRFFAVVDEAVVPCFVSIEALFEHFGARAPTGEEAIKAYSQHKSEIQRVAQRKIEAGTFETTNGVVLKTLDFGQVPKELERKVPDGLEVRYSAALTAQSVLLAMVKNAESVVEEILPKRAKHIVVEWDLVSDDLVQLTIRDQKWGTVKQWPFSHEDLRNTQSIRSTLFRLWDELLQERSNQIQELTATGALGD